MPPNVTAIYRHRYCCRHGDWKIKTVSNVIPIKDAIHRPQNAVFVLLLVIAALYWDTLYSYYQLWMVSGNPAYSHGSLALLIALYIFMRYWLRAELLPPLKIHFTGFVLLLLSSLAWFVAYAGNIQVLQQLAFWALIGALFWCLFGFQMVKVLLIPLAVVLTAIPVWDFLNIHLQHLTAVGVSFLLGFTGIPFVKEGVHILLQSGTFEIADRCSGLRMVVAAVAIALLYIYQTRLRFSAGILYLLATVLLAIGVNILRILTVVIAGHLTQMQHYFVTTDHVMLGWVLFGIAIFAFIFASNHVLLSDRWYHRVVRQSDKETGPISAVDRAVSGDNGLRFNAGAVMALAAAIVGASAGPVMAMVYQPESDYKQSLSMQLKSVYGDWQQVTPARQAWQPEYHGADLHVHGRYIHDSDSSKEQQPSTVQPGTVQDSNAGEVTLHIYYYYHQAQGKEAIHYQNRLYDHNSWTAVSRRSFNSSFDSIGSVEADEVVVRSITGRKKLLWRWYYVGERRTRSVAEAKLFGIKGMLTGHPATAVFILATDMENSPEKARATLRDYTMASLGTLETAVDHAVDAGDKN